MFIRPMHALVATSTLALILAACGESAVIDPGPAASELPTVEARALATGESLAGQTVHAHLNATGTMRKVGDRWLFQTFHTGLGSL